MITGMMHWREEKVAQKQQQDQQPSQRKPGWDEPELMSPEEQEQEMLAYQRHRERQRRSAAVTLPSPDYRSKRST